MPTKKRRIGFIPRFDVLKIIHKISEQEKLSNSKVVSNLIEEALYTRGLITDINEKLVNEDYKNFVNKINDLHNILIENDFKFDNVEHGYIQSKINNKVFKRYIQFLHFKKMMYIFEQYE